MKKILLALALIAINASTFAVSNTETFNDGTSLYHAPNGKYVYIETTNQMVNNALYNRADLVEYHDEVDSTNQKVRVFTMKDYNFSDLHNKVQMFANYKSK